MQEPDGHGSVASPRLTDDQIAVLEPYASPRRLGDGEPLFQAGERRGGFFVVLSGAVEIIDRSGEEPRRVALHGPREFTGDIDIMTRRRPVVSAAARGQTEVLHVPSRDIRRIVGGRPALGEVILRAFIARRKALMASGFQGLRVIGSDASRATFRIREFLTRNHVPFTWIDVDAEPGVGALLESFGIGEEDAPVIAYGSLPLMRNPSVEALAAAIGIRRDLGETTYDLVVVGAGPAGLAAAVYGTSEGLSTLVLDRLAPGGQAGTSTMIENYLGFPTGITGAELTERALLQAQKFGALVSSPAEVVGLDLRGSLPVVELDGGERVPARSVLVATGAEYRTLDVPGRERFDGLGVYYAATHMEVLACQGADVVVVGGGNSAGQAVMFLAEHTRRVLLLLRGRDIYKNMSSLERLVEREGEVAEGLGYVYLDTRGADGARMPLTPEHRTYTVLVYEQHGRGRVGLEAYYTGPQRLASGERTRGYWVTGLMAERCFGVVNAFVNFENILGTRQSNFAPVVTGPRTEPRFAEIWAPMDGFIVNAGVRVEL